ncbi:MAG: prolyl oligopeptidase family serine peptidase [Candidatus Acidiferrales bacterium]
MRINPLAQCAFGFVVILPAALTAHLWAQNAADSASQSGPPVAPVRTVIDDYYGTKVADPYRYMENLKDPHVQSWLKAQNEYTRSVIDRIPDRAELLARIEQLDQSAPARVSDVTLLPNGRYFYEKRLANEEVARLCTRVGLHGPETVLVDPMKYAKGGPHWAVSYYAPSFDGKYLAVGVAEAGSEDAVIHFYDVAKGTEFPETITRTWFGSPAWRPDGHSLYYNRMQKLGPNSSPTDRELNSVTFLHELGQDPEKDVPVLGHDLSPEVRIVPTDIPLPITIPGANYLLGVVDHGVQNELAIFAAPLSSANDASAKWRKVCDFDDDVTGVAVRGDDLYLQSHKDASRYKVLRTSLADPDVAHADVVLAAGVPVVRAIAAASDALYVQELDGGIGRLVRIAYGGKPGEVALPVKGFLSIVSSDPRVPGVLLDLAAWTKADAIYAYDPKTNEVTDTKLQPLGPFDAPSDLVSLEVKARSYDGTMVPLSITYKKGLKLDGRNPTLLWGYGAYGITQDPDFGPTLIAWYERGGVFAMAHVRGGGEYGEDWHNAGKLLLKHNTWRDFIACGEYLIRQKYTSSSFLGIEGGSAGGITIGRSITERPDLFAAAVDQVPMSDAVRVEFSPNGPPNIPEFGSVKTEDGFKGLYEMSAYAHVKKGTAYPAVLITTGANDPRVSPWEPAKLTARLQAATSSGKPILLRVDYEGGHGGIGSTKTQRDKLLADSWSFLLWQFGVPGFQPTKP